MELAHAAGDELGELAAEVEDHDRVGLFRLWRAGGAGTGAVLCRALGRRRVERHLEVGLDLGVVRRENAMAGVGRLAMDGLAALGARRLLVVRQGR
jgi:hypothetical protein